MIGLIVVLAVVGTVMVGIRVARSRRLVSRPAPDAPAWSACWRGTEPALGLGPRLDHAYAAGHLDDAITVVESGERKHLVVVTAFCGTAATVGELRDRPICARCDECQRLDIGSGAPS